MKFSVRPNKTMVSGLHNGEHGRWVDNDRLWADMMNAMVGAVDPLGTGPGTLLPGNIIALGPRELSFIVEIPAGYRTIETHGHAQRYIRAEHRANVRNSHHVFVPKMIIAAQFSAGYRLNGAHLFFSTIGDDVEFSAPEYLGQRLYHTAFSNVYGDGRLCLPAVPLVAPFPTVASMVNTAIELVFGSTFNDDMGRYVPKGIGAYNETHALYSHDQNERGEKWAKLTPEEVLKLKWKPHELLTLDQVSGWYHTKLTMGRPGVRGTPMIDTRSVTTAAHGAVMEASN